MILFLNIKLFFWRRVQWIQLLFKYNFDIVYVKLIKNCANDLSWILKYINSLSTLVPTTFLEGGKEKEKIKKFIPDDTYT